MFLNLKQYKKYKTYDQTHIRTAYRLGSVKNLCTIAGLNCPMYYFIFNKDPLKWKKWNFRFLTYNSWYFAVKTIIAIDINSYHWDISKK